MGVLAVSFEKPVHDIRGRVAIACNQRLGDGLRLHCVVGDMAAPDTVNPPLLHRGYKGSGGRTPLQGRAHCIPNCQPDEGARCFTEVQYKDHQLIISVYGK